MVRSLVAVFAQFTLWHAAALGRKPVTMRPVILVHPRVYGAPVWNPCRRFKGPAVAVGVPVSRLRDCAVRASVSRLNFFLDLLVVVTVVAAQHSVRSESSVGLQIELGHELAGPACFATRLPSYR